MVPPEAAQFMGEREILEQLVTQRLIMQKAEEAGVSFTQEEVDQMYSESTADAGVSEEEFSQLLLQMGISEEEFKSYLEEQMIMNEFLEGELFDEIEVSEEDARQMYEQDPDMFLTVHAKHILVCHGDEEMCPEGRTPEEAEEEALSIYDEVNVDNFEEMATEYSDDEGSAMQGGDLGEFGRGMMVPEFEEVVFDQLEVGEISEPVESDFGYHIIYLVDRRGETFEEVEDEVMDTLREQESGGMVDLYIQQLMEDADIEYLEDDLDTGMDDQIEITEDDLIEEPDEPVEQEEPQVDDADLSEVEECFSERGMSDEVIYLYDDGCPFCEEMNPIVDGLIDEGYGINRVDAAVDMDGVDAVMQCSPEQVTGVPAFVCPTTGEMLSGAVPEEQLESFVSQCV